MVTAEMLSRTGIEVLTTVSIVLLTITTCARQWAEAWPLLILSCWKNRVGVLDTGRLLLANIRVTYEMA